MKCNHLIKQHPLTGKWACGKCDVEFWVKEEGTKGYHDVEEFYPE